MLSYLVPVDLVSELFFFVSYQFLLILFRVLAGKRILIESFKSLDNLKWGVAVRNEEKMKKIFKEIEEKYGHDFSDVKILTADANDDSSLKKMTQKAKVDVNNVNVVDV